MANSKLVPVTIKTVAAKASKVIKQLKHRRFKIIKIHPTQLWAHQLINLLSAWKAKLASLIYYLKVNISLEYIKVLSIHISITSNSNYIIQYVCLFKESCRSLNYGSNKRCLHKDEVGNFADFMQAGDPCFLRKGKRVIYVLYLPFRSMVM